MVRDLEQGHQLSHVLDYKIQERGIGNRLGRTGSWVWTEGTVAEVGVRNPLHWERKGTEGRLGKGLCGWRRSPRTLAGMRKEGRMVSQSPSL